MSDCDFLHDMHSQFYSAEQIADAAACGYNPWEWSPILDDVFEREDGSANLELESLFEELVSTARAYHQITNRYLQIWGELGELFAAVKFGVKLHKPHAQGSDGKLGNDFVEVKTISPEKNNEYIQVKRSGNFSKLLIVKVSPSFEFHGKLIERKQMSKGQGKLARVSWSTFPKNTKSDKNA